METLTLQNHPSPVAVFDGRSPAGLLAALAQARLRLRDENLQAVVIVGHKSGLRASHAAAVRTLNGSSADGFSTIATLPEEDLYASLALDGVTGIFNGADLEQRLGQHYKNIFTAAVTAFPELISWDVRKDDANNTQIHLDTPAKGNVPQVLKRIFGRKCRRDFSHQPRLRGGITMTMSLAGGGTIIHPVSYQDMGYVVLDEKPRETVWALKDENFRPAESWQVADGDLCIMRANGWPAPFFPTVHSSPERKNPGDAQERVVAVAMAGPVSEKRGLLFRIPGLG